MNDAEFIQERIEALEESVEYFSAKNKTEREIWVAESFIKNLNIQYESTEFHSPEQDSPDVVFRDLEFEVKEILDPGRRRHDEYKEELENARKATNAQELLTMYKPIDKSIQEIYQLCLEATRELTKYPGAVRASTDLLFYVNLEHVMELFETPYPDTTELELFGWRSVSFVMGHRSSVFTTRLNTSDILVKAAHPIHHRYHHG
jgi:hypothetical protein